MVSGVAFHHSLEQDELFTELIEELEDLTHVIFVETPDAVLDGYLYIDTDKDRLKHAKKAGLPTHRFVSIDILDERLRQEKIT